MDADVLGAELWRGQWRQVRGCEGRIRMPVTKGDPPDMEDNSCSAFLQLLAVATPEYSLLNRGKFQRI